eukprot:TRINITY_DN5144_c0_g1_i2.p1 TRINITY_DN5144_c0_g1~~TRINITY_DN5144_c0_g1_i2.p1  ORF type:complete len:243 (+),score=47.39 TRINITY_DN5144_c0_g1_i2:64-729(+)
MEELLESEFPAFTTSKLLESLLWNRILENDPTEKYITHGLFSEPAPLISSPPTSPPPSPAQQRSLSPAAQRKPIAQSNSSSGSVALMILLITSKKYYRIAVENGTITQETSLSEIHSVEEDSKSPDTFRISHHMRISRAKVANTIIQQLRTTKQESAMESHTFIAPNMDIRDEFVIVLQALMRSYWQPLFEGIHILVPEVYQYHVFVAKMNASNKGQQCDT